MLTGLTLRNFQRFSDVSRTTSGTRRGSLHHHRVPWWHDGSFSSGRRMTQFVSMSTKKHSGDKRGGFVPIGDVAGTLPGVVPRGLAGAR